MRKSLPPFVAYTPAVEQVDEVPRGTLGTVRNATLLLRLLSQGPAHQQLTDREFEILRMIAMGDPASLIADKLTLSVNTINTYRARILEKMNLKSNAEIIRYALEHSLID